VALYKLGMMKEGVKYFLSRLNLGVLLKHFEGAKLASILFL
jgi:hypothetical protein